MKIWLRTEVAGTKSRVGARGLEGDLPLDAEHPAVVTDPVAGARVAGWRAIELCGIDAQLVGVRAIDVVVDAGSVFPRVAHGALDGRDPHDGFEGLRHDHEASIAIAAPVVVALPRCWATDQVDLV